MGHPITTTVTLAAADDDCVCASQSPGAAGNLTINGASASGGVATLDAARRIIITSGGNDSAKTFTVYGTGGSWLGDTPISETVTGANVGAAQTNQDFLTVTRVAINAASAGTVKVGTNGVGSGAWVAWNMNADPFSVSAWGVIKTGSPTWQVDVSYDDVFGTWLPSGQTYPTAVTYQSMVNLTDDDDGQLTSPVRASRLTLTAVGGVQLVQQQAGG